MAKQKYVPGINIQWPFSQLIVSGRKTIETRNYSLPQKYIGTDVALIETPGNKKEFKARIVAIVRFQEPFPYSSKSHFFSDYEKHLVDEQSPWAWRDGKKKWAWPLEIKVVYERPIGAPRRRGIRFTNKCAIPI